MSPMISVLGMARSFDGLGDSGGMIAMSAPSSLRQAGASAPGAIGEREERDAEDEGAAALLQHRAEQRQIEPPTFAREAHAVAEEEAVRAFDTVTVPGPVPDHQRIRRLDEDRDQIAHLGDQSGRQDDRDESFVERVFREQCAHVEADAGVTSRGEADLTDAP